MKRAIFPFILLLLFMSATRGQAQVCFAPGVNYFGGFSCISVTSADFDEDGLMDLACANRYADKVTILLGAGAGTFTPVVNYTVSSQPFWIANADFNEDQHIDLVTANEAGHDMSVLIGNGNGTFALPFSIPTNSEASSVTCADFNNDGHADIAVTQFHYDSVGIFLGDGAGNFTLRGYYLSWLNSEPEQSAAGDVNEDGFLDLVVGNWGGFITVLIGDGSGAFPTTSRYFTTGIKTTCAVPGDFNSDGHLDIAACNYFSNDVSILNGDGAGNFGASVNFPIGSIKPFNLSTADFDGDGKLDIVTANESPGSISVIMGNGLGAFGQPAVFSASKTTEQPFCADFNNDGRIDIAASNMDTNQVTVFLNLPPPVVTANSTMDTICVGNQVSVYGSGALTYTWTGGVSNGVAFTPTVTTSYIVTGYNNQGCNDSDTLTIVVNSCAGIEMPAEAESFYVYPNPSFADFTIEAKAFDRKEVKVFDCSGKLVKSEKIQDGALTISLADCDAGVYTLQIDAGTFIVSKKLILAK